MGGGGSKSTNRVDIDTSSIISAGVNFMSSQHNDATSLNTNKNEFTLITAGNLKGNITLKQTINASAVANAKLSSEQSLQFANNLIAGLSASIDQAATASAGFLSTSNADANNVSKVKQSMSTVITTNAVIDMYNKAFTSVVDVNKAEIIIGGNYIGDINAEQNIVANLVTSATVDSMISAINDNLAQNHADATLSQTASSKVAGLDDLIKAFGMPCLISLGMSAACVLILVVGIVMIGLSPAGQKSINKASSAAVLIK